MILAKWSEQNTLAVAVKDAFPGAVVSDVKKTDLEDKLDDKIPF